MTPPLQINWRSRFDSLQPLAVIGFDAAAVRLKGKLLSLDDERLSSLQGVFAQNLLFVAGETENLPWADNVIYLGKDSRAPSIFIPTNRLPEAPLDLFEKALLLRFAAQKPFAVVGNLIIPVGEMRPVSRKVLSEIL
jgi:hypothetical protein